MAGKPVIATAKRAGIARRLVFAVAALLTAAAVPAFAASPSGPLDPVKARLVAESAAIAPGRTLWVDLHLDIAEGWHTYWRNPGDSGLPTEIAWTLPAGFTAGDIAWPVPERFTLGKFGNYGYQHAVDLLVPIAVPQQIAAGGNARLAAHASWLVCSDICIPGEAELALNMPVGAAPGAPDAATAALFAAARARLPQPARFASHFVAADKELRLFVPGAALAGLHHPTASFSPYAANIIDAAAKPSQQARDGGLEIVLARATGPEAKPLPDKLAGVLALRGSDGSERGYTIEAPRTPLPPAAPDAAIGWWQALLLAFIGGAILNLMPCVFPVLSLKLLGLANSVHRAEQRRHGAAYAAGVILSFAALGGALLALRGGGAAVGWGFQLQSPIVVALLAYLLFVMGLGLSGVAEFGAGLGGVGGRFAGRGGIGGAFATGVLASVVATPCTAPFMGTALGFALIAPAPLALAVFVALGCGLAAPFVLATAVPGVARALPRPGPWMDWLKQVLAFPLYATVAWLVWVLIQEVGPGGALLGLFGLVVVAFAVWVYGRTQLAAPAGRRLGIGLAAAGLAGAVVLAATLTPAPAESGPSHGSLDYQPFSAARLERLTAAHRPVFVNLTAAWCLTCLVNEQTALARGAVQRAFAEHGVVALKGDWTRQDPAITRFLQKFGRSGVPLYVIYDKSGAPTVLPQILTEAGVLSAVSRL